MLAGSDSCLPAQIGISKAHSGRQSDRHSARPPKNVLWCTCFWVDGAGPGRAKIVPAAAKGWFLELVLVVARDLFSTWFLNCCCLVHSESG